MKYRRFSVSRLTFDVGFRTLNLTPFTKDTVSAVAVEVCEAPSTVSHNHHHPQVTT